MTQTTTIAPTTRAPGLMSVVATLARNDARLFGRDSFLPSLVLIMVGSAVALRFGLPWLANTIGTGEFSPLLVGYIVMFSVVGVGGTCIAFIVLDERDEHTMDALLVTPLPVPYYLGYRLLVAIVIAFVLALTVMYIIGQAMVPFWQLLPIAVVASLMGALQEVFLGTFAGNKVEGFAQMKIISTSGLLLFGAWFVPMPWEWLFGFFPPYWAVKAYWMAQAGDPNWWLALIAGAVLMSATLAYLMRRFGRLVHR
jgi:fluoroquinolone transport system permease protein